MKTHIRSVVVFMGGVVITLIILAFLGVFSSSGSLVSSEKKQSHIANSLEGATQITCTYPQVISANYYGGEITHSIPPEETEPFIFTFSDFNVEVATLKSIDATRTISETEVYRVGGTPNTLTFVEGGSDNYITTHKIFLNSGVAIYSKEVDILGVPSGSLAIGTCVGY